MNCLSFYHDNVDGTRFYGVELTKEIMADDIIPFHDDGKSNKDVEIVRLSIHDLMELPQGLTKVFPKLNCMIINGSKLQDLSKVDLIEYKNLRGFYCYYSQLEFLPGDLFEGFDNLEWISFSYNKLEVIEPNILNGLDKLKHVNFSNNPKFCKCFSIYGNSDTTLQQVKREIAEKFVNFGTENIKKYVERISEKMKKLELDMKQNDREKSKENQKLPKSIQDCSILNDLNDYIQDENTKDFKIEIDGHVFPVHKFLLMIRSPTLAEMLRNNPEAEMLKLVDIPVEVFEMILHYLYTDELPDEVNFLHLFAATSRLKIKKLSEYAAMKVLNDIRSENAVDVLDLGNKYRHDELRQRAFEEIKTKYPKVKFEDDWAMDIEKVKKMIEIFKELEAVERKFLTLKT